MWYMDINFMELYGTLWNYIICDIWYIYDYMELYLVGGLVEPPLWKMMDFVSWDDCSLWKDKTCSKPPIRYQIWYTIYTDLYRHKISGAAWLIAGHSPIWFLREFLPGFYLASLKSQPCHQFPSLFERLITISAYLSSHSLDPRHNRWNFCLSPGTGCSKPRIIKLQDLQTSVWSNHIQSSIWRFPKTGLTPVIIHFSRFFHDKPSSYWGIPIYGNLHIA